MVGGALTAPAVIIFIWMYKMNKRELQSRANQSPDVSIDRKISQSKKSHEENGIDNPSFVSDDSTKQDILDQTLEIVKEFPHYRKSTT